MSDEKKSDIQNLDNALELMNFSKDSLNEMLDKIESTISSTKKDLVALEEEKSKLEKIKKEQEQKISGLNEEQQKLLDEYEQIKGELEKFTKTASGGESMDVGNIRDTLAIYRILLEKIWDAARLLWLFSHQSLQCGRGLWLPHFLPNPCNYSNPERSVQ